MQVCKRRFKERERKCMQESETWNGEEEELNAGLIFFGSDVYFYTCSKFEILTYSLKRS